MVLPPEGRGFSKGFDPGLGDMRPANEVKQNWQRERRSDNACSRRDPPRILRGRAHNFFVDFNLGSPEPYEEQRGRRPIFIATIPNRRRPRARLVIEDRSGLREWEEEERRKQAAGVSL